MVPVQVSIQRGAYIVLESFVERGHIFKLNFRELFVNFKVNKLYSKCFNKYNNNSAELDY